MYNGYKPMWGKWLLLLLVVTLGLSYSGLQLRTGNEANNKAVLTVADYRDFERTAHSANMDMDQVWQDLQDSGVKAVAVSEVTLRDLAYNGDVYVSSYGDFSSLTRSLVPETWAEIQRIIGSAFISPSNLTVVTEDPETSAFLKERLTARFLPRELISFDIDGHSYFIINAQLGTVYVSASPTDKTKPVSLDLDARLGFDERVLSELQAQGSHIVLRPGSNMGSNTEFRKEYDRIVTEYGVKYVIFAGNDLYGASASVDWITELVNRHDLTIGIIEASNQLQYYKQDGLEKVMEEAGYPINRVYSTSNDEFVNTIDERYFRWVRGVVDRGIRILYVIPFKDSKVSFAENLDDTIDIVGQFHGTILDKGFILNQPLNGLSSEMTGPWHRLMISLSLLLAGTIYLLYP